MLLVHTQATTHEFDQNIREGFPVWSVVSYHSNFGVTDVKIDVGMGILKMGRRWKSSNLKTGASAYFNSSILLLPSPLPPRSRSGTIQSNSITSFSQISRISLYLPISNQHNLRTSSLEYTSVRQDTLTISFFFPFSFFNKNLCASACSCFVILPSVPLADQLVLFNLTETSD